MVRFLNYGLYIKIVKTTISLVARIALNSNSRQLARECCKSTRRHLPGLVFSRTSNSLIRRNWFWETLTITWDARATREWIMDTAILEIITRTVKCSRTCSWILRWLTRVKCMHNTLPSSSTNSHRCASPIWIYTLLTAFSNTTHHSWWVTTPTPLMARTITTMPTTMEPMLMPITPTGTTTMATATEEIITTRNLTKIRTKIRISSRPRWRVSNNRFENQPTNSTSPTINVGDHHLQDRLRMSRGTCTTKQQHNNKIYITNYICSQETSHLNSLTFYKQTYIKD